MVLRASRFSPSLPLLKQLHWLPVSYRINCKLSTLTYHALSTQQPPYLASLLRLSNIPRQLRSSISQLIVPKTRVNLGKRAFSLATSRVWNKLPITLKIYVTIAIFRTKSQDISIPNRISTINVRLSLVLILTFARPCLRLCLMILFCCASEVRFLRILSPYKLIIIII